MHAQFMQLNMKWIAVLNPGKNVNQPVCALTKELQFCHPEILSLFFPIFRQLHIEQSLLIIHRQLIEGSGLVQILTENKFSMIRLSVVVDVNNIKRARYTFQVTPCALFIILCEATSVSETVNQPVCALTKELQFCHPEILSLFFPIFRQLHIEQSLLIIHRQLIEGSGLVQILTENKFSMIRLSVVVDVNNIKRARYTFQVTPCALFIILREATSVSETDLL